MLEMPESATISGLANGILQNILFELRLHPKRKIPTITNLEKSDLLHCLKYTLQSMMGKGGRYAEKDFYGNKRGYKCILSKNTYKDPCPNCDDNMVKEAYLGGTCIITTGAKSCNYYYI